MENNNTSASRTQLGAASWWWTALILVVLIALILTQRFLRDEPVVYDDPVERTSSTARPAASAISASLLDLARVAGGLCADHLPGDGFASVGMIYEPGGGLPWSACQRRHMGMDRVFLVAPCVIPRRCGRVRCRADTGRSVAGCEHADLMAFQKSAGAAVADRRFTCQPDHPTHPGGRRRP